MMKRIIVSIFFITMIMISIISLADENLAQNKPIDTNSEWPNLCVDNANDGNINTYWESIGYPASVTIDLMSICSISNIEIHLNPDPIWEPRAQTIKAFASKDGKNYKVVAKTKKYHYDPSTGNQINIAFNSFNARYVKLFFSDGTWKNGAQAAEILVYDISTRAEETKSSENNAENTTMNNSTDQKKILFRDIPWGSNIAEYEKAFEGYHVSKNDDEYLVRWANRKAELDPNTINLTSLYGDGYPAGWGTLLFSMDRQNGLKVSGYNVSSVLGFFAYGVDQDGNVLRDEKDCRFYLAEYSFDVEDGKAVYADLKTKLTKLYGQGNEQSEISKMMSVDEKASISYLDTTITKYIITDVSGGACMLEKVETTDACVSLSLVYANENSDEMLDNVLYAIKHEKKENETSDSLDNYDGL